MKKPRVLICDDNPAIPMSLTGYFEAENMEVLCAYTGKEALAVLQNNNIDLLVLDVMLLGISGLDVCHEIRKSSHIPIIMLSAKSDEIDRIVGLEVGADDYVTKPFSPKELVIRAKKLLKHSCSEYAEKQYILGELTIYADSYVACVGSQRINLVAKEFEVLRYLVSHAGHPMTREQIINAVWHNECIDNRVVDTTIKRLRQKLVSNQETQLHFTIKTVFGIGYKIEEI